MADPRAGTVIPVDMCAAANLKAWPYEKAIGKDGYPKGQYGQAGGKDNAEGR